MKIQAGFLTGVLLATIPAHGASPPLAFELKLSATREVPSLLASRGNQLVNASNEIVRLKGLMIPEPARLVEKTCYDAALFQSLRTHGANSVRIPVHPHFWKKHPDYLQRLLDPAVQWSADCGLYLIIDWHSIGNPETGYAPESPDLFCHTKAMTLDFWKAVAVRYQSAPHVLFEIFNEPARISEKEWRNFANETVKTMRNGGARQLIIIGGLEYGRDLAWVLHEPVAGPNIAYSSHIFPVHAKSGWDHDFGEIARRYPVIMTEWGFIAEPERIDSSHQYLKGNIASYGEPFMTYLAGLGIGWIACWFDDEWEPAMFSRGTKNYTAWGNFVTLEMKRKR